MSGSYPLHPTLDKWNYNKLVKAQELISQVIDSCNFDNGDDHIEDEGYKTYLNLASELIARCYI